MRQLVHELHGVNFFFFFTRKIDGGMANLPLKHRLGWPSSYFSLFLREEKKHHARHTADARMTQDHLQ